VDGRAVGEVEEDEEEEEVGMSAGASCRCFCEAGAGASAAADEATRTGELDESGDSGSGVRAGAGGLRRDDMAI
jgi:hypothetical protein